MNKSGIMIKEEDLLKMTKEEIQAYIQQHSYKVESYKKKFEYAEGFNSHIFNILKGGESWKPNRIDNRVPIAYANLITTNYTGYMAKPGNIKQAGIGESDTFNENLQRIFKKNNEKLVTTEEFKTAVSLGDSFEIHWFDGDVPRFKNVSPEKVIPIYSDTLDEELESAIYYYTTTDILTKNITYNVIVYEKDSYTEYISQEGWAEGEGTTEKHSYGSVPVIHYHVNPPAIGSLENNEFYTPYFKYYPAIFEKVKKLIDANDRVLSEDVLDELQRFASAYLKIRGLLYDDVQRDKDGRTDEDKVKSDRIIHLCESTGDAEFLTKEIDSNFLEFSFNRVEKLVYKICNMVDFSDPKAIQDSGYAFRLQLLSMEFAAITYEIYFTLGLQKRIELLKNITALTKDSRLILDPEVEVNINWIRNIPVELEKLINNISTLAREGLISEKTAIEQIPSEIIPDPVEELKRLDEEGQEEPEEEIEKDML